MEHGNNSALWQQALHHESDAFDGSGYEEDEEYEMAMKDFPDHGIPDAV